MIQYGYNICYKCGDAKQEFKEVQKFMKEQGYWESKDWNRRNEIREQAHEITKRYQKICVDFAEGYESIPLCIDCALEEINKIRDVG